MPNYLLLKVPDSINVDDLRGGLFTLVSNKGFRVISITEDVTLFKGDNLVDDADTLPMQYVRTCDKLSLAEGINVLREGGRLMEMQSLLGHLGLGRSKLIV